MTSNEPPTLKPLSFGKIMWTKKEQETYQTGFPEPETFTYPKCSSPLLGNKVTRALRFASYVRMQKLQYEKFSLVRIAGPNEKYQTMLVYI